MNRLFSRLSAFFVTMLPVAAYAQETAPEAALETSVEETYAEEIHQTHEGSGGLPQFNPDSWPSQIFWLAVSFIILYVFFAKVVLPRLGGTIEARENKIKGDLLAAEELSARAEAIRLGYENELKQASIKISADMKEIDDAAKAKLASSLADFRARYEAEVSSVDQRLDQTKQTAMSDMQNVAAEIAAQAAEKIAGIQADASQAQDVVKSLKNKAA